MDYIPLFCLPQRTTEPADLILQIATAFLVLLQLPNLPFHRRDLIQGDGEASVQFFVLQQQASIVW
jgi:hypothetical protein